MTMKRTQQQQRQFDSGDVFGTREHVEEIEKLVLSMLYHNDNVDITMLQENHFTKESHKYLYNAMHLNWIEGRPPELGSILDTLRTLEAPSECAMLLASLMMTVPAKHIDIWKRNVATLEKYRIARTIHKEYKSALESIEQDPLACLDIISNTDLAVAQSIQSIQKEESQADILDSVIAYATGDVPIVLIPTGWKEIDRIIGGYRKQELYVLAGRPGMGKTAVAMSLALEAAKTHNMAFLSIEMGKVQFWNRVLANLADVPVYMLDNGTIGPNQRHLLINARDEFLKRSLVIDATGKKNLQTIRMNIRHLKSKYDTNVIFVDHIGMIRGTKKEKAQEMGEVIYELKEYAKEYDIAIVALAQLNREAEKIDEKNKERHPRPEMRHLYYSSEIEQAADVIMLLYRPEYYKLSTWEDGQLSYNQVEINFAKVRNNTPEKIRVNTRLSSMKMLTDQEISIYTR